jgi:putative phage-type endonuclease
VVALVRAAAVMAGLAALAHLHLLPRDEPLRPRACPVTARLVLPGTVSEAEWLAARRRGITASEIAVVMGLSPWSSPFALYHRKTGDLPEQADTTAMALGRHLEMFVADAFDELRRDDLVVLGNGRELFAHPERPWQLATPDRELSERCGRCAGNEFGHLSHALIAVLECKTSASYDGWGPDGSDEIPVHYRCQVLWQMDVIGVTTGYVATLFLHSRTLRVYELTMDDQAESDLGLMRAHARIFLTRIEAGDPPPVDWRPATGDALRRLHPLVKDEDAVIPKGMARAYLAAVGRYRTAEQRKKLAENRIRERVGPAARVVLKDGTAVASRSVYPVKEHVRKACTVDKLIPAKDKDTANGTS